MSTFSIVVSDRYPIKFANGNYWHEIFSSGYLVVVVVVNSIFSPELDSCSHLNRLERVSKVKHFSLSQTRSLD